MLAVTLTYVALVTGYIVLARSALGLSGSDWIPADAIQLAGTALPGFVGSLMLYSLLKATGLVGELFNVAFAILVLGAFFVSVVRSVPPLSAACSPRNLLRLERST